MIVTKNISPEVIELELEDLRETVAMNIKSLGRVKVDLGDQLALTGDIYGERMYWPASSEHHVRVMEARQSDLETWIADTKVVIKEYEELLGVGS